MSRKLTRDEKREITALLVRLGLITDCPTTFVIRCLDGSVNSISVTIDMK